MFIIAAFLILNVGTLCEFMNTTKINDIRCNVALDYIYLTVTVSNDDDMDWSSNDALISYWKHNTAPSTWKKGKYCDGENLSKTKVGYVRCQLFHVNDSFAYKVQVTYLDKSGGIATVPVDDYYVPASNHFNCYTDHDILDFTATSTTDSSLTISWKYPPYDRRFFLSSAMLQIVEFENVTHEINNISFAAETSTGVIDDLIPCKMYNVCVLTGYNIGIDILQCWNTTTSHTVPIPTNLKIDQCNSDDSQRTLSWQSDVVKQFPSTFFQYSVNMNNQTIVRNTTDLSAALHTRYGMTAYVKTCTKCGCSKDNQLSIESCESKADLAPIIAGVSAGVVIFLLIAVCLYKCWNYWNNRLNVPDISPRDVEPIYDEIPDLNPHYQSVLVNEDNGGDNNETIDLNSPVSVNSTSTSIKQETVILMNGKRDSDKGINQDILVNHFSDESINENASGCGDSEPVNIDLSERNNEEPITSGSDNGETINASVFVHGSSDIRDPTDGYLTSTV